MKRYLVNKCAVNDWSREVYLWPIWTGFIQRKMSNQRSFPWRERNKGEHREDYIQGQISIGNDIDIL